MQLRLECLVGVRVALAILALLLAWGCTGSQNLLSDTSLLAISEEGLSPSALALLREAKRHARVRIAGAATGGAVGAVASVLPSRDQSGGARGAIVGGASGLGAVLGYAFGEYIDARSTRANMDQEKLSILIKAAQRDAMGYQQDRINAERAIEDSRQAVTRLEQGRSGLSNPERTYQEQARALVAIAASLHSLSSELTANIAIMSEDVLEAYDNQAIGDKALHPAALEAERTRFQAERDSLTLQHKALVPVALMIPEQYGREAVLQTITGLTPQ